MNFAFSNGRFAGKIAIYFIGGDVVGLIVFSSRFLASHVMTAVPVGVFPPCHVAA